MGPDDVPPPGNGDVPAGMRGETVPTTVQPPSPAPEPRDLQPLPLPAGVTPDDFDIALAYNGRVEYWLRYFQRDRGTFAVWLERMSRYEPFIRRDLTAAGLPSDLIYLALIESGFTPGATSSASAVGIWQFMAGTARLEGLEVSTYIDERRDPIRATRAAVHHLASLYHELGSWYLVAAAYNSGSGRVTRALDAVAGGARGADSLFWRIEPVLPAETRDYVPKFLAASIVGKYPERFGITPGLLPGPDDFDVVHLDRATDLAAVARAARTSEDVIRRLNPEFYLGVTPPGRRVAVRVPAGLAGRVLARLDAMPRRERVHDLRYTADRGDTPPEVAERFGISLAALRKANHLKKKTKLLAAGRALVIPLAPQLTAVASRVASRKEDPPARERPASAGRAAPAPDTTARAEVRSADLPAHASARSPAHARAAASGQARDADAYVVRAGDTLARIAEARGTTVAQLRELNGLERGALLHPGQRLRLSRARVLVYRVHEGDTLWRIAHKHGVSVDELRDWNGLAADAVIRPGDEVELRMQR